MDSTSGFHIALYILAVETFLFFAVVAQTVTQEPLAHAGVARYFGFAFLLEALASLTLALASHLRAESTLALYLTLLTALFVLLGVLIAVFGATHVLLPESDRRATRAVLFVVLAAVVVGGTVKAHDALQATPPALPFFGPASVRRGNAAVQGAMAAVLVACVARAVLRPATRGKNGAVVLLVGTALSLAASILWTYLLGYCEPATEKGKVRASCPLPTKFDHNVLFLVVLIVANVLSAEGVLRLMAVGDGDGGYSEIP